MAQKIRITCRGATAVPLDKLHPLQGGLKKLSQASYQKLRTSLLKHGFSFPFFAWKDKNKLWILDGHQRDIALRKMQTEGYDIPPLPIALVEAKDEKEAKEKILLISSQYGEMTEESLLEFIKDAALDIDEILGLADLRGFDLEKLLATNTPSDAAQKNIEHQFNVLVECKDEAQQLGLIEKLESENYTCRALIL